MCSVSLSLGHFLQLGIGDEDVGRAVLAVVDEEVGLGPLRQRVLARVRVRRPLRHRPLPLRRRRNQEANGLQGRAFRGQRGYSSSRWGDPCALKRDPSRRLRG